MSEIWNLSTLCRCCHSDGCFKSLNQAYHSANGVEIYEILLHEILGIRISQPQIEASYTICDTCIKRLKDAAQFKQQVLVCETKFQVYCTNELFLAGGVIDSVKDETNSQNNDSESDSNYLEDNTFQCDENNTAISIKEEVFSIEVDLKHPIEHTKEEIKLKEETIKNDVEVNLLEENDGKVNTLPSKRTKKPVLQKDNINVKEKTLKTTRKPTDGGKKWQRQKLRLKLLNSYIVQVKTKTGLKYSCKTCDGSYKNKKEILKHIRLQHISRYKCDKCCKPFPNEYTLRRHMKNVHGSELYECCHCKKSFTCKSNLKVHENSHTKELVFKCDTCDKIFLYRSTLRKHIKQMHTPGIIYNKLICDMCGLSFYDRTNLEIHIKTVHWKQRPFACNICGKTYTARKHVKYHMRVHSDNPKPYQCDLCPKKFACIKSFKSHKIYNHSDNNFPCRHCNSVFETKKERDCHSKSHPQSLNNSLTCHVCGKTLMTRFTLNRHLEVHKGIKRYGCEICGFRFTQKALLERHYKRKHDPSIKIEKVKCLQCKKMVRNIDKHMSTHDDKKRYYCDICGKSYAENNALTRHKNHTHFGVSYDCVYCGKKYINKRCLASHETKVHKVKRETVESADENKDGDLVS